MNYILMYGALFAVLYFFMIKPQKDQQKKLNVLRNNLEVGNKIVSIGGLIGTIVSIKGDDVGISVNNTETCITLKKWAIRELYVQMEMEAEIQEKIEVVE